MKQTTNGREMLERVTPELSSVVASLEAAMGSAVADAGCLDVAALAARVVAAQHDLPPIVLGGGSSAPDGLRDPADAAAWRDRDGLRGEDRTALRFAEQMSFDVGSLQAEERAALFDALGPAALAFVQSVYVADLTPRVRDALDALFGASDWTAAREGSPALDLQSALDALIREVPKLQALDPVTTEAVRVLGAHRHQCRLCQSLRSRSALVAGAGDALFEAVEAYSRTGSENVSGATNDLTKAQRVALDFVDGMVGVPGRVGDERAAALHDHFGPEACVEIVLDVMRNATNKIAVALGADAPHVDAGYEIYDVGPDGELHYGLEAP